MLKITSGKTKTQRLPLKRMEAEEEEEEKDGNHTEVILGDDKGEED